MLSRSHHRGITDGCANALEAAARDARDRAARVLATLTAGAR